MKYKLKETDSNLEDVLSILDYIHLGWCELYWIMCRAVIPRTVYAKSRRGWRVVEKLVDSVSQNWKREHVYYNQGVPL